MVHPPPRVRLDWPQHSPAARRPGIDAATRVSVNSAETVLTPSSVPRMKSKWTLKIDGATVGSPVVLTAGVDGACSGRVEGQFRPLRLSTHARVGALGSGPHLSASQTVPPISVAGCSRQVQVDDAWSRWSGACSSTSCEVPRPRWTSCTSPRRAGWCTQRMLGMARPCGDAAWDFSPTPTASTCPTTALGVGALQWQPVHSGSSSWQVGAAVASFRSVGGVVALLCYAFIAS